MLLPGARPILLGHRGAPRSARENTLVSFERALEAGLDGFELDIQKTADGVLVVNHDPTIQGQRIDELPWREVRDRNHELPRLEEVFELLEGYPDAYLNLELKVGARDGDGREELLSELLASRKEARSRNWISSFDPRAIERLHRLDTPLPLALLAFTEEALKPLRSLPIAGVHPDYRLVTDERLRAWKGAGLFVVAWTVNEEADARRLIDSGVDGLIGDEPRALLRAAGRPS